jgi:hypothetical protein
MSIVSLAWITRCARHAGRLVAFVAVAGFSVQGPPAAATVSGRPGASPGFGRRQDAPYLRDMSQRVPRAELAVRVECMRCRHVAVLSREVLARGAIGPEAPNRNFREAPSLQQIWQPKCSCDPPADDAPEQGFVNVRPFRRQDDLPRSWRCTSSCPTRRDGRCPPTRRLTGRTDITHQIESARVGVDLPENDERADNLHASLSNGPLGTIAAARQGRLPRYPRTLRAGGKNRRACRIVKFEH